MWSSSCIYAKIRSVPYLLPPARSDRTDPGCQEVELVKKYNNNQEIKRLLMDNSLKEEE